MPMMATTIISSMSVKPCCNFFVMRISREIENWERGGPLARAGY
jgi:hypothetical protein